jgi:uncharacterized protein YjiS (DUF1127 family)
MSSIIAVISPAAPLRSPAQAAAAQAAGGKASSLPQRQQAQAMRRHMLSVYSRLTAWRMRRATSIILHSLDERILRDIGLERSEITRAVGELRLPPRWQI